MALNDHKIVKVKVDPIVGYITLWNGTWRLTDMEVSVLSEFLRSYLNFRKEGLKEPYLSKFLFSTENKKEIKSKVENLSEQGLANYIASLKRKNIIIEKDGVSMLDERVIPVKKITFEFNDY
jgi:hypothetical protein